MNSGLKMNLSCTKYKVQQAIRYRTTIIFSNLTIKVIYTPLSNSFAIGFVVIYCGFYVFLSISPPIKSQSTIIKNIEALAMINIVDADMLISYNSEDNTILQISDYLDYYWSIDFRKNIYWELSLNKFNQLFHCNFCSYLILFMTIFVIHKFRCKVENY